jgi:hypothetical protein
MNLDQLSRKRESTDTGLAPKLLVQQYHVTAVGQGRLEVCSITLAAVLLPIVVFIRYNRDGQRFGTPQRRDRRSETGNFLGGVYFGAPGDDC